MDYAVTLYVLLTYFFQNDMHQLRQHEMYLDKQDLEEEDQEQEQPLTDEVCCLFEDRFELCSGAFAGLFIQFYARFCFTAESHGSAKAWRKQSKATDLEETSV